MGLARLVLEMETLNEFNIVGDFVFWNAFCDDVDVVCNGSNLVISPTKLLVDLVIVDFVDTDGSGSSLIVKLSLLK